MQWTVRLEARASAGEVKTTELVTFPSVPMMMRHRPPAGLFNAVVLPSLSPPCNT